jgi:hypothetical protein
MLLFTAKARGLIDGAVLALPDAGRRQIWAAWSKDHPRIKVPDGPVDDGGPPPPRDVVFVALEALEELGATKRHQLNAGDISDDEASDIEMDLTYISGLHDMLNRMPAR